MGKTSVIIMLRDSFGNMALQLRAKEDDSYPLHWDFSAAGGVEHFDESLEIAAVREVQEELGIKVDLMSIGKEKYNGDILHLFSGVYDGACTPGPEVERVESFSIEEIHRMIKNDEPFHPEFVYVFKRFYR
jgi:isopentenyl-diphosphate delta-isomerase